MGGLDRRGRPPGLLGSRRRRVAEADGRRDRQGRRQFWVEGAHRSPWAGVRFVDFVSRAVCVVPRGRVRDARAGFGEAEYWNPETGAGLGAAPQSWSALAACMEPW
nr:hypothetical protein OG546_44145 [Streptomyces antimycoticus]